MFKLQNMKGKLAGSVLGVALVVSLAAMGFVAPAFADTADTEVGLIMESTGPTEGTDYDVNVPSGGIMGTINPTTGNISYNVLNTVTKPYSVEFENKSILPLKISAVDVTDIAGFNYVASSALETASASDSLATTIKPYNGGMAVEIADAQAGTVNPTGTGWNNIPVDGTQGYVFGDAGVKNLTKSISSTTGVRAYTVTWTVDFAA